ALYGGVTTLTFSLEYLGERLEPSLLRRCQASNGSYGASPSATAYAQLHAPNDEAARYLQHVVSLSSEHGVMDVYPINIFETAWSLQSLLCVRDLVPEFDDAVRGLLHYWTPMGVGHTDSGMIPDSDDTATVLFLLRSVGELIDADVLKQFEDQEFFICFPYERNQSVRANAAIVEALKTYPSDSSIRRMLLKAVQYIKSSMNSDGYWHDKWHISPFYASARCISALNRIDRETNRSAINWILGQQHENGAWGVGEGTQEETAYALDGLISAGEHDQAVASLVRDAIHSGYRYLIQSWDEQDYEALWLGKGLYTPQVVVRSAIVGSLIRCQRLEQTADV
ncbi:MAG TPA: prenyltransferase/squalene oxidase repeat-containing protein, partial [Ktedonobacteraceae bacterium]